MRDRQGDDSEYRVAEMRPPRKKQASPVVVLLAALAAGGLALVGVRFLGPNGRAPSTAREPVGSTMGAQAVPGAVPAQLNVVPSGNLVDMAPEEAEGPAAGAPAAVRPVPVQAVPQPATPPPPAAAPAAPAAPPQVVAPPAAAPQGYPAPAAAAAPIYYYAPAQMPQAAPPQVAAPYPTQYSPYAAPPAYAVPPPATPTYGYAPAPGPQMPAAQMPAAAAPPIPPGATPVVAPPVPTAGGPPPGWAIGLRLADIGQSEAAVRSGTLTLGVLAAEVTPGGAAERAGLAAGDRIVAVGAQPVVSILHFFYVLAQQPAGVPVRLDVVRQGWLFAVELRDLPGGLAEVRR